jgi:phosphoenolpyruvate synthase/pyruvate phosphate dikinase
MHRARRSGWYSTPHPIADLAKEMPPVYRQLRDITNRLEKHYRDVQDFEFTVQEGTLFMLQTRTGKRTAHAAVKIAVDMVAEGLISKDEAVLRVEPASLEQFLHPIIDPKAKIQVIAKGLPASPGYGIGESGLYPTRLQSTRRKTRSSSLDRRPPLTTFTAWMRQKEFSRRAAA